MKEGLLDLSFSWCPGGELGECHCGAFGVGLWGYVFSLNRSDGYQN